MNISKFRLVLTTGSLIKQWCKESINHALNTFIGEGCSRKDARWVGKGDCQSNANI